MGSLRELEKKTGVWETRTRHGIAMGHAMEPGQSAAQAAQGPGRRWSTFADLTSKVRRHDRQSAKWVCGLERCHSRRAHECLDSFWSE